MQRVIEVIVSPTGETVVQTTGYVGPDCVQASRFLEEKLGTRTTERLTADFYEGITRTVEAEQ